MKNVVFSFKLIATLAVHVLFWIGIYFFYTYFLGYGSTNTAYVNKFSKSLMPVTIVVSYFFLFYLIPNYLLEKKQRLFILYSVYTFIVSFFFIIVSILYGLIFSQDLNAQENIPLTKGVLLIVLGVYMVVLIVISIGLIQHNYRSVIKNEDIKNKFLETQLQLKEQELKFLKMQIHPHFLFNTLNTLYGFALKKSEATPDMILKLSNLLDYILYQVDKPQVLLQDEIKHIEDYISLEKMRFQDSLEVDFVKELHVKTTQISPMLLLPFVENAFKHGVQIDGVLKVAVNLKTDKENLYFEVQNNAKEKLVQRRGIGLENIQKRLQMLFKEEYTLEVNSNKKQFKIYLKIPLQNV